MDRRIQSTAEISLEELYKMQSERSDYRIVIAGQGYKLDTFIKMKIAINEMLKKVPKVDANDPDAQKKVFSYIYTKMAHLVSYDELAAKYCDAVGYERDKMSDVVNRASGLEGALLHRSAVCSGQAETLKNLLEECGIESKIMSGKSKTSGYGHAWNQVKLDGVWYHCDITNDAGWIKEGLCAPHFLKSNEDCTRMQQFNLREGFQAEETGESVSEKKQYELISEARKTVEAEFDEEYARIEEENRKYQEKQKRDKRPKFVNAIIDLYERAKERAEEAKNNGGKQYE